MNVMLPVYLTVGLIGLAIGSFLNVVIYRVPREESLVEPGSHCPSCRKAIRPWHNIPVFAWLFLRGRCADCHTRISVRYPLVEAGTALLFVAVTYRFGFSPQLPAYLYLSAVAVTLALIDFDVKRLPDSIVLPSYVVGVLLLMPAGAAASDHWAAGRALAAMFLLLLVYSVLALAYPMAVSYGEAKLAGVLGLYLGWLGWGAVAVGVFAGLMIGAAAGSTIAITRRSEASAVPFGSCMVAGAFIALFVAAPLSSWYSTYVPTAL